MSVPGLLQVALYVLLVFAITKPLGLHLYRVFSGERTLLDPLLRPAERLLYRLTGVNPDTEQSWKGYAFALLTFSAVGALATYAIERLQNVLPFNPQGLDGVPPDLAFNNWVSAAAGIAISVALVRGLARRSGRSIGNFWVDLVRATLYVLLPLCF